MIIAAPRPEMERFTNWIIFKILLVMFIMIQASISIGLLISAITPNMSTATMVAPAFVIPFVLFGGFLANNTAIPVYINWMQWISPIRFANEALAHLQFDDIEPCRPPKCLAKNYMETEGFTIGYWKCVFVLIGMALFWRLASLVALRMMIKKV